MRLNCGGIDSLFNNVSRFRFQSPIGHDGELKRTRAVTVTFPRKLSIVHSSLDTHLQPLPKTNENPKSILQVRVDLRALRAKQKAADLIGELADALGATLPAVRRSRRSPNSTAPRPRAPAYEAVENSVGV